MVCLTNCCTAYNCTLHDLARELHLNTFPVLLRRFIHDQIYPDLDSNELPEDELPEFDGPIAVHKSAFATFYAPSEQCGPGGMHREAVRSTPTWRREHPRYDTVLIQKNAEDGPFAGLVVGRVKVFFKFDHEGVEYQCALVEWYVPEDDEPDPVTGMWIVKPEFDRGRRTVGIIHLDSVFRACHLEPVFGGAHLPLHFHFSYTLDTFQAYYVNKYIDYHSHECLP